LKSATQRGARLARRKPGASSRERTKSRSVKNLLSGAIPVITIKRRSHTVRMTDPVIIETNAPESGLGASGIHHLSVLIASARKKKPNINNTNDNSSMA
jgi:hypothetical protein